MFKQKQIYTILLIGVMLVSGYGFVVYSYRYNIGYKFIPCAGMLISFFLLTFIWKGLIKKMIPEFFRRVSIPIIIISVYSLLSSLQERYMQYQLKQYGIIVKGMVVDSYFSTGYRGKTYYYAEIAYRYNKLNYKQTVGNYYHTYKYHDSVEILCSSNDPEIFEIIDHKPALNIKY